MDSQEEDIIEKFLKENSEEIRRVPFYKKPKFWANLKSACIFIGGAGAITFALTLLVKGCNKEEQAHREEEHRNAQRAYILVQYGPDGHVLNCWVTPNSNNVAAGGQTVGYWLSNWKIYPEFATKLGADPKKCDVWNWDGKVP